MRCVLGTVRCSQVPEGGAEVDVGVGTGAGPKRFSGEGGGVQRGVADSQSFAQLGHIAIQTDGVGGFDRTAGGVGFGSGRDRLEDCLHIGRLVRAKEGRI